MNICICVHVYLYIIQIHKKTLMNKYPTNTSHLFLLRKGLAEWAVKEDFHTVIYVQYGLNDFW